MKKSFPRPSPYSTSVDIGAGRLVKVRAYVDPATKHAEVSIAVCHGRRLICLAVDWNELFNSGEPFLCKHEGLTLWLTVAELYEVETETWRLLSAQGHVPTEWYE